MIISIVIIGNSPTVSYEQGSMLGLVINRKKRLPGFILRFSSIVAELLSSWQSGSLENASGACLLAFIDFFQYHHSHSFMPLPPTSDITYAHPTGSNQPYGHLIQHANSSIGSLLSFTLCNIPWISMSILHLFTWTMTTQVYDMTRIHPI